MKIKSLQRIFALLTTTLILASAGNAEDKAKIEIPVGGFEITFMNDVKQSCEFSDDGTVKVTQDQRTAVGRAEVSDGKILVRYEDDRIEQWMAHDGAYFVNHWHPISSWPKQSSQMGLAEKKLSGAVEVHEWGTFTILQGSDGKTLRWYQAPEKLVDLPPFVQQHFTSFGKARSPNLLAGLDSVRMETPVLYFYPEKEMDIRVSATFPSGRITEVFPPASYQLISHGTTLWRGKLLPPNAAEKSRIPAATGSKGRHYAAARAVPEAWLFSQIKPETDFKIKSPKPKVAAPIDHFIFYRGAGNGDAFPIRAVEQEKAGTYKLSSHSHQTIPKLFALRVVDGRSSWTTINQLAKIGYDSKTKTVLNEKPLVFPEATQSTKEVAVELRDAMVAALQVEGLTAAEAKAMVATWDDLWFTDPGTRVLALLPQSFADEMVPLQISPTPTKIERVFVARMELINRAQEEILTSILDPEDGIDENLASEKLADLQLGRYAAGGMARAQILMSEEIEKRFTRLEKLHQKRESEKTASTR